MRSLALVCLTLPLAASASDTELALEAHRRLTSFESEAGWQLLFDGETTAGWRGFGQEEFPDRGWTVEDGCLRHVGGQGGGDLVSAATFGDFELELEWKVAEGGNSGVKLRINEAHGAVGLEYQLLDDVRHPDGEHPKRSAGALYDVLAPQGRGSVEPDVFHHARIVARGPLVEHWLDGKLVVAYRIGSAAWKRSVAESKFAEREHYGGLPRGHVLLQDHGDSVWFRNVRIRDLDALPGEEVELLDGMGLDGWEEVGDARWTLDDGAVFGEVGGGSQSFLVTERTFGDFLLEMEVKLEGPGNSGIQVRSHQKPNGRVFGYQIEIDPSDRAWSGGLYDEARRGWLQNLEQNEPGRAALHFEGWNHYRIECLGPWIRAWVNGVPTADWIDPLDLEGFIALQVHSGKDTRVRWARLRLQDFGTRSWIPVEIGEGGRIGRAELEDFALRLHCRDLDWALTFGPERSGRVDRVSNEQLAPALYGDGRRWRLDARDLALDPTAGMPEEIVVCAIGERLTVHLDGKLHASVSFQERAAGVPRLLARDARASFDAVELLGEPK